MDAGDLYPWARESGRSLWNSGHRHQAVMQAAIRINAETQAKLGRVDVSEAGLFNEAFSLDDPKAGSPRLRLAENDGGRTYQNMHRGARAFADGLFTAIRNPGMHTPLPVDGGSEQIASEQPAAFSLLVRWVDQARVVTLLPDFVWLQCRCPGGCRGCSARLELVAMFRDNPAEIRAVCLL